jgi:hypothetical protein
VGSALANNFNSRNRWAEAARLRNEARQRAAARAEPAASIEVEVWPRRSLQALALDNNDAELQRPTTAIIAVVDPHPARRGDR